MFDGRDMENVSPANNRFNGKQSYNAETKSEFQFPINNQRNKVNVDWDQKSRQIPQSYYARNASKSPNNRAVNRSRIPKSVIDQQRNEFQDEIETRSRDKLIEAEVYK